MLSPLKTLFTLLVASSFCSAAKQPLIFDSDYGPFIDDVFALGLLANSLDIVDLKLVLATSDRPELSATCIAAQLELSGHPEIEVAVGSPFPDYSERGSVCAIQGILGFAMEPECNAYSGTPPIENGVEYMAKMIMESGRSDWWYLVVGGQSSLRALIEQYPEAAAMIDTVIVMAGNWCADFEPYPNVMAPTDETNIGCDPAAANFVLDGNNIQFNNVYYVPVVMADEIGGEDYKIFVDATETNAAANATLTWYKIWSEAGRADPNLLIHDEAMAYDPDTESTPQFDPVAVMLALELLVDGCDRMTLFEMEGIHFFEADDEGLQPFPAAPRSAFSLHTGLPDAATLPAECPNITSYTFDVADTPEKEYPVKVALGFNSAADKAAVYADMARRMAGETVLCGMDTSDLFTDETPTEPPAEPPVDPPADSGKQPLIFDSDYGPFIDDVFALGLLANSLDIVDLKLVLATSDRPELSATCIAAQLELSGHPEIEVAVGSPFPDYSERGSVCAIQGILGFAMEPECNAYSGTPPIENGVEYMAKMILESGRSDWWYLVVGGQSSLRALIEQYPEAAAMIDTVIVMAGNWCADFEPYPNVMAPTDETNIGCDPAAANFVLDGNNIQFNNVYYVPVVMADEIGGEDYKIFVDATETNAAANATLTWYKIWSEAGRADPNLLIHDEAMAYDPDTESTPQFDPVAVMLALELLVDDCDRMTLFEMEGIHFFEADDAGLQPFPAAPRSAFSLHTGLPDAATLPAECPNITSYTFDVADTPEKEYPVKVALGFNSAADKAAVYADMARRMAGETVLCGKDTSTLFTDPPVSTMPVVAPTDAPAATVAPVATEAPVASPTAESGVSTRFGWFSVLVAIVASMLL